PPDAPIDDPGDAATADAVTDAAFDVFDAGLTFCKTLSPAPAFCADFDDLSSVSPTGGFVRTLLGSNAALAYDVAAYVSAPRALRATSTQGGTAAVEDDVPMTTGLSVELDVRFAVLPPDGQPLSPVMLTPPSFPG